jgi:hypothetical protein
VTDYRVVRITATRDRIRVSNRFGAASPIAALVRFARSTARVELSADNGPFRVEAPSRLRAESPIHVCLSPVDGVCFESDYSSSLDVLDEPRVIGFFARGRTELTRCPDRRSGQPPREESPDA